MSLDVEDLLRSGMERFTEGVAAPRGLAARAARARRRRRVIRAAAAVGTACAAVTAVAVITAAGGPQLAPASPAQARTAAYVIKRVQLAVAGRGQHLVMRARTTSTDWGPSVVWGYGATNRFEEFIRKGCQHALANGDCTRQGGSERYLAQGTARIGGKLTPVYVAYYNREWSVVPGPSGQPASACSATGAVEMSGPPPTPREWPAFIQATLACGAATVTGHVRIGGVELTKITAKPRTVPLGKGEARAVREKYVRVWWTLYVNSKTYLPVRLYGSDETFGGPAASTHGTGATDIQWLPPTRANKAKALVAIPAGFRHVSWRAAAG
jgi:hypothetical protein